ncbi:S41 family peptidase [Streptomyces violaceorubidus]
MHVAPVDGGPAKRLTHWGSIRTQVRGWTADGRVLALSTYGQASLRRSWAAPSRSTAARRPPCRTGPSATSPRARTPCCCPRQWAARPPGGGATRGGTAGKLWIDREDDGEFVRLHDGLDGNIEYPFWVGDRIAFLSDHEGTGALYSSLADGSDLRRHTDHDAFYARNASSDGTRVVYPVRGRPVDRGRPRARLGAAQA